MVKCRNCDYAKIYRSTKGESAVLCSLKTITQLNPDEERECSCYEKKQSREREKGFFSRSQYSILSNAGMIACIAVGLVMLVLGVWLCSMGIKTENGEYIMKNWMFPVGLVVSFIGLIFVLGPFFSE